MKTSISTILLTCCATTLCGQNVWTLDDCINYAVEHNLTVKSRQNEVRSGEIDIDAARDRFLPNVSGYASQSFSFGRGLTADNTYTNRNTSNFGWGLNMSLPLFQGLSAVRQTKYAKANMRVLVEELAAAKDDITLNVISAYLQVLYADAMLDVAREQLRLSQVEESRRAGLLEAGKIAELELTEARAQVAQNRVQIVNAENDRTLALVDLVQLLELADIEGFDVAPINEETSGIYSADEVYNRALENNHTMVASRRRIDAAESNISLAKAGYLPQLSLTAGLGSSYYTVSGVNGASFNTQMRNNFNKTIGFSLQVPIFDAMSTRNSVRRAKISKLNAELQYESNQRALYKSIQQAYYQAVGAKEKYDAAQVSLAASREAYEAMQQKYEFGRANSTELEQAQSNYVQAMAQSVQAKYESILRKRILEFYNK